MRIFRSEGEVPADFGPSAVTIGNFDGVHAGHRSILRRLKELADRHGWKPSVLTFDPHPTQVVAPGRAPQLMTSPERRAALMSEEGIEQVLILPFTPALAQISPEDFVRRILVERLGARAVLVGDNFRFGHRHAGNVALLADLGRRYGFETEIIPAVQWRGHFVSSSAIRLLLREGRVSRACRYLQHPFWLEGDVVEGRGVGSRQTVPTLNLAPPSGIVPAAGVYVTRTSDLGSRRQWKSVTNIGYRPTFGDSTQLTIETFLLDAFDGDTPRRIALEFLWYIREERKFASPEALKARILHDAGAALRYFRRLKAWTAAPRLTLTPR